VIYLGGIVKEKYSIFKRLLFIFVVMFMTCSSCLVNAYAVTTANSLQVPEKINSEKTTKEEGLEGVERKGEDNQLNSQDVNKIDNFIGNYFGSDIFSNMNLTAGYQIAQPFAIMILTLTLALVIIIIYAFFGQTAVDLAYLTLPFTRSFFNDKAESQGHGNRVGGGGGGHSLFSISESAQAALGGGSSGGLNGGGERGVGSCILKYIGLRTGEFVSFVLFIVLVFTGLIGRVIIVIFHLFLSLLNGFLSFI